ncbi:MAG: D-alanine--D-alanine ligase [Oscillospiraceae bacterium]|nr:D-alanine--D-alanine ligase [Oscillospiraceae bacterium]
MRIVVLAGGLGPERDVSLSSGSLIANALINTGYKVCMLDLYTGVRTEPGDFESLFFDLKSGRRYNYSVPEREPDLDKLKEESGGGDSLIGGNVMELCKFSDLVFLGLHGDIGENGKLQAIFDAYGILYTGTGYTGSLLAMDKEIAKTLMLYNNIKTPEWETIDINPANIPEESGISFPFVVKPLGCGSSCGVSIVRTPEEYADALEYAVKYIEPGEKILIEKYIEGREFSVGILDGEALPAIEIIPKAGFYDYKNKYQFGLTDEICPADLPEGISVKMGEEALKIHKILRMGSYSRIDFIIDKNNNIYCLEANTLPGMTPTSLLPQEAAAAGISYEELCDRIVRLAVDGK